VKIHPKKKLFPRKLGSLQTREEEKKFRERRACRRGKSSISGEKKRGTNQNVTGARREGGKVHKGETGWFAFKNEFGVGCAASMKREKLNNQKKKRCPSLQQEKEDDAKGGGRPQGGRWRNWEKGSGAERKGKFCQGGKAKEPPTRRCTKRGPAIEGKSLRNEKGKKRGAPFVGGVKKRKSPKGMEATRITSGRGLEKGGERRPPEGDGPSADFAGEKRGRKRETKGRKMAVEVEKRSGKKVQSGGGKETRGPFQGPLGKRKRSEGKATERGLRFGKGRWKGARKEGKRGTPSKKGRTSVGFGLARIGWRGKRN